MKKDYFYQIFIDIVREKIPDPATLSNYLSDILCIERSAVYRRLGGTVPFSFVEIALISSKLGISLDSIVNSTFMEKSRSFQLKLVDHYTPSETDYVMMEEYINVLRSAREDPDSTILEASALLPTGFYWRFRSLARFYLLKWVYHYADVPGIKVYKELDFTERTLKYARQHMQELRHFNNVIYILDPLLFGYVVNDMKYYESIGLMDKEDIQLVRKDLYEMINLMEKIASNGYHEDPTKRIRMYISNVNFDANYWYIETGSFHVNLFKVFVLNDIASIDDAFFERLKKRTDTLIRSSTMISVSGERQRFLFFDKQRKLVDTLEFS